MNEMIDMVAEAIMRVDAKEKISDYYKFAREAIKAIREPTEEILEVGYEAMFDDKYNGSQAPLIDAVWKAMIDKVLEE